MKALSVKQPNIFLIINQGKPEIRTWKTNYRGDILLCSSQRFDRTFYDRAKETGQAHRLSVADILAVTFQLPEQFPVGQALCIVKLIGCQPMTPADEEKAWVPYREGLWAWKFMDVRPLKPFPVKGRLGL